MLTEVFMQITLTMFLIISSTYASHLHRVATPVARGSSHRTVLVLFTYGSSEFLGFTRLNRFPRGLVDYRPHISEDNDSYPWATMFPSFFFQCSSNVRAHVRRMSRCAVPG